MSHRGRRTAALAATLVLGLGASACQGQRLPASVVKGTKATVAWSGGLGSANAASVAGATPADREIAAVTRSRFAEVVEGKVRLDPSFGKVTVTDREPFTVRYDLAEPAWSDGVALDAADLLLAWEAGSDTEAGFQATRTGLAQSDKVVRFDESHRAIEVSFTQPVPDWNTALDVAVPAHVVGRLALGLDDPMEAKKAVSDAIRDYDSTTLAKIAKAWNEGFALEPGQTPDAEILLSSGPYRVNRIANRTSGEERVELVANGGYAGSLKPTLARIDLVQMPEDDRVAALGHGVDVVQLTPTRADWEPLHELQRRDYHVSTSHDGTMWVIVLRVDRGLFTRPKASAAFLRAVPRGDLRTGGGGGWSDAFAGSDALLFAPGSEGYDIALEDSGFQDKLGKGGQGTEEIVGAGLTPGTPVCVAYDENSEFARGAIGAMRTGMVEAGWSIRDCGRPGFSLAKAAAGRWDAALARVPVPDDPTTVAAMWGSDETTSLTGASNAERDDLLTRLQQTTDPYDARDLRAQVEKSIVDDAIALPVAMNPIVTVTTPGIEGVSPRPGAVARLLSSAAEWSRATS